MSRDTSQSSLPLVVRISILLLVGIAHVQGGASSGGLGCVLDYGFPAYTQVSHVSNILCYAVLQSGQMCSGTVTSYETLMDPRDLASSFKPRLQGCKINRKELTEVEQDCFHMSGAEAPSGSGLVAYYRVASCARRYCDSVRTTRTSSIRCRGQPGTDEGRDDRELIRSRVMGSPGIRGSPGAPGSPGILGTRVSPGRAGETDARRTPFFPSRITPEDSQEPTDLRGAPGGLWGPGYAPGYTPGTQNLRPCREVRPTEEDVVCDSQTTLRLTDEARRILRARVQDDIENGTVRTSYDLTEEWQSIMPEPGRTCFHLYSKSDDKYCITNQ